MVGRIDGLVEIIAPKQEVDRPIEIGREPHFLREGVDIRIADVRSGGERRTGEIDVLVRRELGLAVRCD